MGAEGSIVATEQRATAKDGQRGGRRPTLAFLTPYLPWPPDTGGKNRSYNILRALAQAFTIDLCTVQQGPIPDDRVIREMCRSVHHLWVPPGRVRWGWRGALLSPSAITVRAFHSRRSIAEAAAALSAFWHDAIFIDELVMAPYARYLPSYVPRVVMIHKPDFDYQRDMARQTSGRLRLYHLLEAAKLRRVARTVLAQVEAAVLCSPEDDQRLQGLGGRARRVVIPNGVDVDYCLPAQAAAPAPPTMLYVGTMNYPPNIDALLYFHRTIYARIVADVPDVRLLIVGKDPTPAVRALARPPAITVTGTVDDVRPYYDRSHVSIVPLRIGGGTRLKILESFAMGVPVVSTRVGIEGIQARDGEEAMIADDPAEFAQRTVQLLRDDSLRLRMAAQARRLAETRYAWSLLTPPLIDEMLRIAAAGQSTTGGRA